MKILATDRSVRSVVLPMLALGGQVDINTADAETISAELKGIGLSKAQSNRRVP